MDDMTMINKKLDRIIEMLGVPKDVFTGQEAAEYLCISYDALMRYSRIGAIRYAKNGTRKIFKKEWLDDFLENGGMRWMPKDLSPLAKCGVIIQIPL